MEATFDEVHDAAYNTQGATADGIAAIACSAADSNKTRVGCDDGYCNPPPIQEVK
jgi:hypothetical protein